VVGDGSKVRFVVWGTTPKDFFSGLVWYCRLLGWVADHMQFQKTHYDKLTTLASKPIEKPIQQTEARKTSNQTRKINIPFVTQLKI
jgi:hypothetical protein